MTGLSTLCFDQHQASASPAGRTQPGADEALDDVVDVNSHNGVSDLPSARKIWAAELLLVAPAGDIVCMRSVRSPFRATFPLIDYQLVPVLVEDVG